MKRFFNKIKAGLVAFRIALISFPLKVKGLDDWWWAPMYWIENYHPEVYEPSEPSVIIATIIKIAPRLLVAITFIVWTISFIKLRKINDKTLKKKKIRNTIIVIAILILILIAAFVIPALLLTK